MTFHRDIPGSGDPCKARKVGVLAIGGLLRPVSPGVFHPISL